MSTSPPYVRVRRRGLEPASVPPPCSDAAPQDSQTIQDSGSTAESPSRIIDALQSALISIDSTNRDESMSPIFPTPSESQDGRVSRRDSLASIFKADLGPYRPPSIHILSSTSELQRSIDIDQRSESDWISTSRNSLQQRHMEEIQYRDVSLQVRSLEISNPSAAINLLKQTMGSLMDERDYLSEQLSERSSSIDVLTKEIGQLRKDKDDFLALETIMGDTVTNLEEKLEKAQCQIASMAPYRRQETIVEPCHHEKEIDEADRQIVDLKKQVKYLQDTAKERDDSNKRTSMIVKTAFDSIRALMSDLFERRILEASTSSTRTMSPTMSPERLDSVTLEQDIHDEDEEDTPTPSESGREFPSSLVEQPQSEREALFRALLEDVSQEPRVVDPADIYQEADLSSVSPGHQQRDTNTPLLDDDIQIVRLGLIEIPSPSASPSTSEDRSVDLDSPDLDNTWRSIKSDVSNEAALPSFISHKDRIPSNSSAEFVGAAGMQTNKSESLNDDRIMEWTKALPTHPEQQSSDSSESFRRDLNFAPVSSDVSRLSFTLNQPESSQSTPSLPSLMFGGSSRTTESEPDRLHTLPHGQSVMEVEDPRIESATLSSDAIMTPDEPVSAPPESPDSLTEYVHHSLPKPISMPISARAGSRQRACSPIESGQWSDSQKSSGSQTTSKLMMGIVNLLRHGDPNETLSTRLNRSGSIEQPDQTSVKQNREKSRRLLEGVVMDDAPQVRLNGLRMHKTHPDQPSDSSASQSGLPSIEEPLPSQSFKRDEDAIQEDGTDIDQKSQRGRNIDILKKATITRSDESPKSDILDTIESASATDIESDTQSIDDDTVFLTSSSEPSSVIPNVPFVPFHPLVPDSVRQRMKLIPVRTTHPPSTTSQWPPRWSDISTIPSPSFPRELFDTICERLETLLNDINWQQVLKWIYIVLMGWLLISTYLIRQQWLDGNSYMVRDAVISQRDESWSSDWLLGIRGVLQVTLDAITRPGTPVYHA